MAKIKISRKKEWNSNPFEVYLDKQRIGYISKGETREFDIPPGEHKIKVKTGIFGSKIYKYSNFNKESKTLIVSGNWTIRFLPPILIVILVFGISFLRNTLELELPPLLGTSFMLAIFVIFFIIGRNNYLKIKEDEIV